MRNRGRIEEAYEVTAGTWESKTPQAELLLRSHNLHRIHILARNAAKASGEDLRNTIAPAADITVLDVREEIRSLVARLGPPYRGDALRRLYQHLVDLQLDDRLVNLFVSALYARGLVA